MFSKNALKLAFVEILYEKDNGNVKNHSTTGLQYQFLLNQEEILISEENSHQLIHASISMISAPLETDSTVLWTDRDELWFQQDGATCHTARATIDLLKDTFGDRLISRFGPVNRPPRSCDLTPLDYFLWGYVKSLVYADKPQTLDHLEDNIRRGIADIRPQMLEKVIENWTSRLDYIRASRGSPMPEIIFKISIPLKNTLYIYDSKYCPSLDATFSHLSGSVRIRVEKTGYHLKRSTNGSNFLLLHKTGSAGLAGREPLIETSDNPREQGLENTAGGVGLPISTFPSMS
ncbi:uncharacterized protein TNCV_627541 [Trichonephila clavipes]|nr:uncharacterized protein TNCV_627541 [Trichonephila clavipes]